jgi:predicted nicotinamide N-methyase
MPFVDILLKRMGRMFEVFFPFQSFCRIKVCSLDRRVLELGAGVGLLSLVCCHYRPSQISSTDGNPIVLDILERNLSEYNENKIRSHASILEWGSENAQEFARKADSGFPRCDLHRDSENSSESKLCNGCGYDCILIADCTYSVESAALLMETVHELLSLNGVCLLAHRSV